MEPGRIPVLAIPGGQMKRIVQRFWSNQSGATAIEYALIAAGISLAIITVVNGLGLTLSSSFTTISISLK
jgi:pilus assembly protein Flp/PilA